MGDVRELGDLGLSYGEVLAELDQILAQLDRSEVDVDTLADRVARGAVLVRYCRDRLRSVKTDVDGVVADLVDEPVQRSDRAAAGGDTP